jgi:hypothetical protein
MNFARMVNWAVRHSQAVPAIRRYRTRVHLRRREAHSVNLPELDPSDAALVATLERDAICAVPIASLGWPGTGRMLDEIDHLSEKIRRKMPRKASSIGARYHELSDCPALRGWGLSPRAQAVAERYLGLPIFYDGPHVRCELRGGRATGVRQWHLDTEDRRVLKLILYINDVGHGGGPFEYLPLPQTEMAVRQLKYSAGLVADARLERAGLQDATVEATYPRHTAIFVDAARLFHRAQPPRTADRLTATFCWISVHGHRDHHPNGRVVREIPASELPDWESLSAPAPVQAPMLEPLGN